MFILAGETVKMFEQPMSSNEWKRLLRVTTPTEEKMVREKYLDLFKKIKKKNCKNIYIFTINGAAHTDLTDAILIRDASLFGKLLMNLEFATPFKTDSINGISANEIVNTYLVNFFDKYLKGKPSELLNNNEKKLR